MNFILLWTRFNDGKLLNILFDTLLFVLIGVYIFFKIRQRLRDQKEWEDFKNDPTPKGLANPEIYKEYFGYYPEGYDPRIKSVEKGVITVDFTPDDADSEDFGSDEEELEDSFNRFFFPEEYEKVTKIDFSASVSEKKSTSKKPGNVFQFPGTKKEEDS